MIDCRRDETIDIPQGHAQRVRKAGTLSDPQHTLVCGVGSHLLPLTLEVKYAIVKRYADAYNRSLQKRATQIARVFSVVISCPLSALKQQSENFEWKLQHHALGVVECVLSGVLCAPSRPSLAPARLGKYRGEPHIAKLRRPRSCRYIIAIPKGGAHALALLVGSLVHESRHEACFKMNMMRDLHRSPSSSRSAGENAQLPVRA